MKKFFLPVQLICTTLFVWAQDDAGKQLPSPNPYQKGKWRMPLIQYLQTGFYSNYYKNSEASKQIIADFNFEGQYFFQNHWGVGLSLGVDMDKTKYSDRVREYKDNHWSAMTTLTYGQAVRSNKIYWNTEIGIGAGGKKEKDKTASSTSTDEIKFWNYKVVTGLDIRVGHSNVFINPFIGWEHYTNDHSSYTPGEVREDISNFNFGLRLMSSMFCSENNNGTDRNNPTKRYERGRSFIGYTTEGIIGFGKHKKTYNGSDGNKWNNKQGHISLDYNYFITRNFALGIIGIYEHSKMSEGDYAFRSYMFGPKFTGQMPVDNEWRNLFGEFGVSFGGSKYKSTDGMFFYSKESSITNYLGGLGYNIFLSPNISFTPIADYVSLVSKDKDSSVKTKRSGINLRFGIRYML